MFGIDEKEAIQLLSRYQQRQIDREMESLRQENEAMRAQISQPELMQRQQRQLIAAQQASHAAYEEYLAAQHARDTAKWDRLLGQARQYSSAAYALRVSHAKREFDRCLQQEQMIETLYMNELEREAETIRAEANEFCRVLCEA